MCRASPAEGSVISRRLRARDAGIWARVALLAVLVAALGLMATLWGDSAPRAAPVLQVVPPTPAPTATPILNVWQGPEGALSDVVERSGPEHCDWQSATFIGLKIDGQSAGFVYDPKDVVPPNGSERPGGRPPPIEAPLPADAEPTGFRHGDREIWLGASAGDDAIYIVSPEVTQRWPKTTALCA